MYSSQRPDARCELSHRAILAVGKRSLPRRGTLSVASPSLCAVELWSPQLQSGPLSRDPLAASTYYSETTYIAVHVVVPSIFRNEIGLPAR
jgi:hypothetical protein